MEVLLVEDHQESRKLLARWLTRLDYNVVTAEDLQTGLDCLDKQRFDAIISDIALPDGTGYELIGEVRRRGIRVLSIAVSAYPYPSDVGEPGVTGFRYHLKKPVNLDDLRFLLDALRFQCTDSSRDSETELTLFETKAMTAPRTASDK